MSYCWIFSAACFRSSRSRSTTKKIDIENLQLSTFDEVITKVEGIESVFLS